MAYYISNTIGKECLKTRVMKYRLACFDLDGTLMNTIGGLTYSLNAARRMNGLAPQTEAQAKSFINNGVVKFIERSLAADPGEYTEELKARLLKDNVDYYNSHYLEATKPYNGITEVLLRLKSEGMLLACVTNKNDEPAKGLIEHFFPDLFDYVSGAVEGVEKKPSYQPMERCLHSLGVDNSEAIYIGDTDTDILTAKNAQMCCISCTWGYKDREFLIAHGAENICTEPLDLMNFMR